jgi:membrane protein required for colicin V production
VHWFDIGMMIALLLSGVWGYLRGLVRAILSLIGLAAASVLAVRGYPDVAELFTPLIATLWVRQAVGFALIFLAVVAVAMVCGILLRFALRAAGLSLMDRLLGGLFGLAKVILVASILLMMATRFFPSVRAQLEADSVLAPFLFRNAEFLAAFLKSMTLSSSNCSGRYANPLGNPEALGLVCHTSLSRQVLPEGLAHLLIRLDQALHTCGCFLLHEILHAHQDYTSRQGIDVGNVRDWMSGRILLEASNDSRHGSIAIHLAEEIVVAQTNIVTLLGLVPADFLDDIFHVDRGRLLGVLFQEILNGTKITGKIFPIIQLILGDLRTDFEGNAIAIEARRANLIRDTVNIETIFFFRLVLGFEGVDARGQPLRGELMKKLLSEV